MGNRYDEVYNYRMATIDDVESIMEFIREEWSENHILAHNKALFLWQYGRNEYNDNRGINFVLMLDKANHILGLVGFVAYDKNNESISPAITKVKPEGLLPLSGLELMKRQMQIVGEKEHFSSGTNPNTILPLYKKVFKNKTGYMQQYYMLNPNIKKYSIALPGEDCEIKDFVSTGYSLVEAKSFTEVIQDYDLNRKHEAMSVKSPEFIEKRYFKHPIYEYKAWMIKNEEAEVVGVLFGREISREGSKILRLVDFRGNPKEIRNLGKALHEIMIREQYEYIDLMVSDLSDYHLDEAGFSLLNPDGKTIIPHYFEPFVRENKKNYFQDKSDIIIFKADGDQDRPSVD